jgi:thioredoxin 2
VRKAAELLAGSAAVVQVNTDENPTLSSRFGVRGIPAVYLLRKGTVLAQVSGARSAEALVQWFRSMQNS